MKLQKIKILRVVSRLNIGGVSVHLATLDHVFNDIEYDSYLIFGRISDGEGDMRYLFGKSQKMFFITHLQREINLIRDLTALIKIIHKIIVIKHDIIETHMSKAGFLVRIAAIFLNFFNKKKISTIHMFHGNVFYGYFSSIKSKFFLKIEQILSRFTDVVIAISETQKKDLTSKYNICPRQNIVTINLGFNLMPFCHLSNLSKKGDRLDDCRKIRIGIVGRLVPVKNHKLFLDSAKLILQSLPNINFEFLIVGDGGLKNELIKYCNIIGISEVVEFTGWIKNLPLFYSNLDILLLTSINEGTPVSIIEAMASRVAVISTDVGGVRDLLGNSTNDLDSNGLFNICERGIKCQSNALSVAMAIEYMIEKECYKDIKLLNRSQRFVIQNYGDNLLGVNLDRVYKRAIKLRSLKN